MKPRLLRTCLACRLRPAAHAARPPHRAWLAVSLCWRKSARLLHSAAPRAGATTARSMHQWTSFHLHLALSPEQDIRPRGAVTGTLPGAPRQARPPRQDILYSRHMVARHTLIHRTRRQHEPTRSRRPLRPQIRMLPALPKSPARIAPAMHVPRATKAAIGATGAFAAPPQAPNATAPLLSGGAGHASAGPAQASSAAPPPARTPATAQELIWRKQAAHGPADAATLRAQDLGQGAAPAVPMALGAASAANPAQTNAPVGQQLRETVRGNLLDGPTADRLAEDVLRRVEKRLRIERERRGG